MKNIDLLRKYGIKLTYIAKKMGMSESLLRYHLAQSPMDAEVEKKFHKVLSQHSEGLNKQLKAA